MLRWGLMCAAVLTAGSAFAQDQPMIGISVVNAEIFERPGGIWDVYCIVYNLGDLPITLYGIDGPAGEDGFIFANGPNGAVEILEMTIPPGHALDLVSDGLFLRFEELDDIPVQAVPLYLFFDDFEMEVETAVIPPSQ